VIVDYVYEFLLPVVAYLVHYFAVLSILPKVINSMG
jgi:ABC-type microcin C transport system permease subunit YejB